MERGRPARIQVVQITMAFKAEHAGEDARAPYLAFDIAIAPLFGAAALIGKHLADHPDAAD